MEISNELRNLVDPNSECCCEHSLGNKCKEWATSKNYQIISGLLNNTVFSKHDEKSYAKINYYTEDKIGNREYKGMYIIANTEIEAVIKACEYALKEINENR